MKLRLHVYFTPQEIDSIEKNLTDNPQIKLAFKIFKYTGIRLAELIERCKKKNINIEQGYITAHGKNNEDRNIPMFPALTQYIKTNPWYNSRKPNDGLFTVSKSWVTHAITFAKQNAGIEKKGSAHILRHSLGTYLLNLPNTPFTIRDIQAILGHKTLYMTTQYTHVINTHLKTKIDKIKY